MLETQGAQHSFELEFRLLELRIRVRVADDSGTCEEVNTRTGNERRTKRDYELPISAAVHPTKG